MAQRSLRKIDKLFIQAQKELEAEIDKWYARIAKNNNITLDEARKLLSADQLREFHWTLNEYTKNARDNLIIGGWDKELENASAKWHISKYEALKLQTRRCFEELYAKHNNLTRDALKEVYRSGYYHTAFELQRGFNIGWDISGLNDPLIEKILSKPWAPDHYNFSQRIWRDKNRLIKETHQQLTRGLLTGQEPQKAIDAIAKKLNTSRYNAGRLVMTESAYFSSVAQKNAFNDLGVEQYKIVATLDDATSDICRSLDGKVFPMKDFEAGVTAPPFHVWCRSTTVPYFEDDFGSIGERAAKDEHGKTYYVPADMTYEQWKEKFVDGGDKNGLTKSRTDSIIRGRAAVAIDYDGSRHYAHRVGTIDPKDTKSVDELVSRFENKFVNADRERCLVICANGEVYLARGGEMSVNTSDLLGDRMKRSFTSHNHPAAYTQYSFSREDLRSFLEEQGAEMRAFDFKYEYEVSPPVKRISIQNFDDTYAEIKLKSLELCEKYGLTFDNYEENIQHIIVKETCELLGIRYCRRNRNV